VKTVYLLDVSADAGRGDYIGTNSVHDSAAGALAALRAHYERYGDWYAECGVMDWEGFAGKANPDPDCAGYIGAEVELVTGTECGGLVWYISPRTVHTS
jgi:hypothetical protein